MCSIWFIEYHVCFSGRGIILLISMPFQQVWPKDGSHELLMTGKSLQKRCWVRISFPIHSIRGKSKAKHDKYYGGNYMMTNEKSVQQNANENLSSSCEGVKKYVPSAQSWKFWTGNFQCVGASLHVDFCSKDSISSAKSAAKKRKRSNLFWRTIIILEKW